MLIRIGTHKYHIAIGLFYLYDGADVIGSRGEKILNFFEFTISAKVLSVVINTQRPFLHMARHGHFLFPKFLKETIGKGDGNGSIV